MFKKQIIIESDKLDISLLKVWKKMNWDNKYSDIVNREYVWRVTPKYNAWLHICNICRGIVWVVLFSLPIYVGMEYGLFVSGNILSVILNISIIFLPVLLFELFILYKAPIEISHKNDIRKPEL